MSPYDGGSQVLRGVYKEAGVPGLFQGLIPRMGLNINLTLFMVSGAHMVEGRASHSAQPVACTEHGERHTSATAFRVH